MEKVSNKEMVDAVAELAGVPKSVVREVMGSFVQFVQATSKSGNAVSVAGLGTFRPQVRAQRTVNTPLTTVPVVVPSKTVLSFKAAKKKA